MGDLHKKEHAFLSASPPTVAGKDETHFRMSVAFRCTWSESSGMSYRLVLQMFTEAMKEFAAPILFVEIWLAVNEE
jgi:hypothetical protein